MIKVHENKEGVEVELISRQPTVYLDQWAIYRLANDEALSSRFFGIMRTRGTLFFSWINITEIATTSPDTLKRIGAFLEGVGEHWLPLESNPDTVIERERSPGPNSPCLSESLVLEYYPHIHGESLSLARIVELVAGDSTRAKQQLVRLKKTVLDGTRDLRTKAKANPEWVKKAFPAETYNPHRPTAFVYSNLYREMVTNRGWTLTPNDAVDLIHCVVAAANSDIVLLDRPWTQRVKALGLPSNRVRAYYEGELERFFQVFEHARIESA